MTQKEAETLRQIWKSQKLSMDLPGSPIQALQVLITKVFNPTKKRSSLLSITQKMPYANDFTRNDVERLESYGYIVTIPTASEKKVTITPEGIIGLEQYQNELSDFRILQEVAYKKYREFSFHKIERLRKEEKLKPKHIAVLLFFLLNGSIGLSKAYQVRSPDDSSYLEKIVGSFISDDYEVSNDYTLKYYLVEAKRILGDVAFNKKPNYYLKEKTLDYVLNSIQKEVKGNRSFYLMWKRLKGAYRENVTFLRTRGNSYYTTKWEMELDRLFLNKNE